MAATPSPEPWVQSLNPLAFAGPEDDPMACIQAIYEHHSIERSIFVVPWVEDIEDMVSQLEEHDHTVATMPDVARFIMGSARCLVLAYTEWFEHRREWEVLLPLQNLCVLHDLETPCNAFFVAWLHTAGVQSRLRTRQDVQYIVALEH